MNFSLPGANMPDIEQANRTLQEQFRVNLYRLPYKIIPRTMIKYLALCVTRHGNYFPAQTGIRWYYSPHTIVSGRQVKFKKEFNHSFGDYVQAKIEHAIRNQKNPWTLDCIYLHADDSLKDGHQAMELTNGNITCLPKV